MLAKWPIRNKLFVGLALLLATISVLSWSAFYGLYAYRGLVKSLERVAELRRASELNQRVSDLRVGVSELRGLRRLEEFMPGMFNRPPVGFGLAREQFRRDLSAVKTALENYRVQLTRHESSTSRISDSQREQQAVRKLEAALARIDRLDRDEDWVLDEVHLGQLSAEVEQLQSLTSQLPGYLHQNIQQFVDEVRLQRRTFVSVAWATSIATVMLLALLVHLFYKWVFRPLRVLIKGSRKVAAGHFHYRIQLNTRDEMSELAEALNDMTERFQSIRDDLDRQVQERTRQVVRSEQLASVGFLAAGVAHEINNPLASVALCAESLEERFEELAEGDESQRPVVRDYLRMIQTEAFRCKQITDKLLDFSRLGETQRQHADLRELVEGVIEMVGHLGKYQGKTVRFLPGGEVVAPVNAQEIKQVVLNLLTNGLESLDPGGVVMVELSKSDTSAELVFTDDGCGMSPEVLEHLFEPFFTRRRSGQGTGLGLSITYRIVAEHGGHIEATSQGPGHGSQFRVSLPLVADEQSKEASHRYQAV